MDTDGLKTEPQHSSGVKINCRAPLFAEADGISLEYCLEPVRVRKYVFYTITVSAILPGAGTERAVLRELTSDLALAESILAALCDGAVPPCAAPGVADDLLAEAAKKRALSRLPRLRLK